MIKKHMYSNLAGKFLAKLPLGRLNWRRCDIKIVSGNVDWVKLAQVVM
jgi:hypothetical protein